LSYGLAAARVDGSSSPEARRSVGLALSRPRTPSGWRCRALVGCGHSFRRARAYTRRASACGGVSCYARCPPPGAPASSLSSCQTDEETAWRRRRNDGRRSGRSDRGAVEIADMCAPSSADELARTVRSHGQVARSGPMLARGSSFREGARVPVAGVSRRGSDVESRRRKECARPIGARWSRSPKDRANETSPISAPRRRTSPESAAPDRAGSPPPSARGSSPTSP
jgi:hypothetical protein